MFKKINNKRVFKNVIYISTSRFLKYFFMLIFTMLSARYLKTDNYGLLSYYLSTLSIIALFFTFGSDTYIVLQISKDIGKADRYISQNIVNRNFLMIFVTIGIVILNNFILIIPFNLVVLLLYLSYIFDSYRTVADGYYQAVEKMQYISYIEILRSILLLAFLIISMYLKGGIYGLAFSYFFSTMISLIISYYIMFFKLGVKLYKSKLYDIVLLIKNSTPYFINALVNVIAMQLDVIMINNLSGNIETGYYNSAKKLINIVLIIPGIVTTVLLPRLSNKKISKNKNKKIMLLIFIIGLIIGSMTFSISKFIIELLYGEQYIKSYYTLNTFSMGFPLIFLNYYLSAVFIANGKQKFVLNINILTCILNAIVNYFLIPRYGSNGAAIATISTMLFGFILYLIYYKKYVDLIFCKAKKSN
ncbi:flippase [Clostridium sp. 19966]|uniref:flippase n=1 Tax=Clostridium sp. 19966 TaxID=2768166 RepID=UPI0028E00C7D|nr:flippase [Clostridium sp. 19966]MDT8716140.1 flippase [Clostridium sp. 19966]